MYLHHTSPGIHACTMNTLTPSFITARLNVCVDIILYILYSICKLLPPTTLINCLEQSISSSHQVQGRVARSRLSSYSCTHNIFGSMYLHPTQPGSHACTMITLTPSYIITRSCFCGVFGAFLPLIGVKLFKSLLRAL